MKGEFAIREATVADATVLARHRVGMFRDMGDLPAEQEAPLFTAARRDLADWLASGDYSAWVASPVGRPEEIVAGAGVQLRPLLPRPDPKRGRIREGREAIVLNVYTEPAYRRRGIARLLMEQVIAWVRANGIARLVLHASPDGRPLYEQLGFEATNEMRFMGELT